jgi:tetratricopeptide (TPR) repeat protein
MLFLLEIPAVKNLVHREVTAGKSNELIRLALANNNRSAIDILIAIPAVHDLAEENNYADAIFRFRKSIKINTNFSDGYYNLASLLSKVDLNDEAIENFKNLPKCRIIICR